MSSVFALILEKDEIEKTRNNNGGLFQDGKPALSENSFCAISSAWTTLVFLALSVFKISANIMHVRLHIFLG